MGALTFIADGLANILTGRGTQIDRASHNFWFHMPMGPDQIEAAYRSSWLISKIVDLVPMDMVREWREWEASPEEVKKIEAVEKRLKVMDAILSGLIYGRLGGGVVILGSGTDMAAPVRPSDKLLYVKALPRHRIGLGDMDWDVKSENFGEPGWFTLAGTRSTNRIHPSRVIVFKGERVPGLVGVKADDAFWGDSIIDRVNQAVKNANVASDGFATLIDEAKIDVFRFSAMAETLLQPDGDAKIKRRVELTSQGKSTHRAIFLDKEDEWENRQLTWTGMPDMIRTYLAIVAGAADIPATRLLGKSPDGQNATGESDEKNYRSGIRTRQLMYLRPALDKLDALLLPTAGVGAELTYSFCELDAPTEKEQAEIDKLEAETVDLYASSGLIPLSALAKSVQARMVESERWPALKDELAKAPEIPDIGPNEADPSALQATKGGDPASAGAGGTPPPRRAVAANDAAPRTLYVQRKLLNAAEFIAWAKGQGFETTAPADELHVTIAYSRQPLDWMKVGQDWHSDENGNLTVPAGGARLVEPLGDKGAVVLLFNSSALSWRHEAIRAAGASFDFDEYQPHVTVTYAKPVGLDLAAVEPFRGKLEFGPEIFQELEEGWRPNEA